MLRRMVWCSSLLAIASIVILATSCGSSNSNTPPACTGGPFNVGGNWLGTFSGGGSSSTAIGAINSTGTALFFDSDGDTFEFPAITGATCSFAGNATIFASQDSQVNGGAPAVTTGTANGVISSDTAISGTAVFSGGTDSFTLATTAPLPGAPTAIGGSHIGQIAGALTNPFLNFTFTPSGTDASTSFTATDNSSCSVTGSFTQEGATNVFDVSMTLTGASCFVSGALTGVGFESNTDLFSFDGSATGTYFYANVLGPSPFVIEIFP